MQALPNSWTMSGNQSPHSNTHSNTHSHSSQHSSTHSSIQSTNHSNTQTKTTALSTTHNYNDIKSSSNSHSSAPLATTRDNLSSEDYLSPTGRPQGQGLSHDPSVPSIPSYFSHPSSHPSSHLTSISAPPPLFIPIINPNSDRHHESRHDQNYDSRKHESRNDKNHDKNHESRHESHQWVKAKAIYQLSPEARSSEGKVSERAIATEKLRAAQFNGRPQLPWNNLTAKASPTGQYNPEIFHHNFFHSSMIRILFKFVKM